MPGTLPNPALETPPTTSVRFPADVVNLKPWKITLPVRENGKAMERKQPKLATFSHEFFALTEDKKGVRFRCHHGGETTSGSENPRSELREMTADGSKPAKWATNKGRHTLTVRGQVNRLTRIRPHVVIAQIHNGSDDVTVFRVEGRKLFVTRDDDNHAHLVTGSLGLGDRYEIGFDVFDGKVNYIFNGHQLPFSLKKKDKSCFFKAGNYLQSNKESAAGEVTSEFSEVVIVELALSHET